MEKIGEKLSPDTEPINKMTSLSTCWELLYHIEKDNIKSKQDVIILMVHLTLIKNDFLCIHEEDEEQKPVKLSELLPSGWNSVSSGNNFRIRYYNNEMKFHFGANLVEDMLAMNFLNMKNQSTQTTVISLNTDVQQLEGSLDSMVPNHKELFCKIWTEVVKPASSEGQRDMNVQTEPSREVARPRHPLAEEPRFTPSFPDPGANFFPRGFDPMGVGSRDLNPFGPIGGGGGMLLENPRGGGILMPDRDFPGPGRLPRGSVPPGARFDPIHPSHPGRRGGPDPDHLPMPGRGSFSDHMFM